jgi:hypothetical protein
MKRSLLIAGLSAPALAACGNGVVSSVNLGVNVPFGPRKPGL